MNAWQWSLGLALLAVGCAGPSTAPPVIVGHVSDLGGAGTQAAQGIRLALQQVTDEGISRALGDRPLHVRHTDTQGRLDSYEAQAIRLVAVHRAVALLGGTTPEEVARLDHAHLPLLSFLGFPPQGVSRMAFYLGLAPGRQGEVLGQHVAGLKVERVLLLVDEQREASAPLVEAFTRAYEAGRPGARPTQIRFGKEPHWEEIARRITKESPGAVVFAGRARDWRELRAALQGPIPMLVFAGDDGDFQGLPAHAEPIYLATAFVPAEKAEFVKKYQAAFKVEPDVHAALGYDALRLLADALKRSAAELGKADALRDALAATQDFPAMTGPLTITGTHQVRRPVHVARLAGGTLTSVKVYPAQASP